MQEAISWCGVCYQISWQIYPQDCHKQLPHKGYDGFHGYVYCEGLQKPWAVEGTHTFRGGIHQEVSDACSPRRFVRIRHYGLLSSRNKNRKITLCRNLLGCKRYISRLKDLDAPAIIKLLYNKDVCKCSSCGGNIIPLPSGRYCIRPEPHLLCCIPEAEYLKKSSLWRLIRGALEMILKNSSPYAQVPNILFCKERQN